MKAMEKNKKELTEAEKIAEAEKEFLAQHASMRRLSSDRMSGRGGVVSGASSLAGSESESDIQKVSKRKEISPGEKKKPPKKSRIADALESDSEDYEEECEDALDNVKNMLRKLRGWVRQPALGSKISKPQMAKYDRYLDRLEDEVVRAREERVKLEARVEDRMEVARIVSSAVKEEIEKVKSAVQVVPPVSYSAIARQVVQPTIPQVSGVRGPVMPAPKQVIVRHETKESSEVEATMKRLVRPSEIGLKVKRLISIRNGVIVEAENEEGAESLVRQEALRHAGLKVERPAKKKPLIMVYDIRADLSEEEIKEEVYNKNMLESQIVEEEFKEEFQVKHRYKDRKSEGKWNNILIECTVRVRNWLRAKERIFIEWNSCRVKDYNDVPRCYNCQKYGHVAKYCKSETPSCSQCAGEHSFKECPDKNKENVCCVNCKRDGRPDFKHEVRWKKCPFYEKAMKRYNEKIDYGG